MVLHQRPTTFCSNSRLAVRASQPNPRNHGLYKIAAGLSTGKAESPSNQPHQTVDEFLPFLNQTVGGESSTPSFLPPIATRRARRSQNPLIARLWNPTNSSPRVASPRPAQSNPTERQEPSITPSPPKLPNTQQTAAHLHDQQRHDSQSPSSLQAEPATEDGISSKHTSIGYNPRIPPRSPKGKEPARFSRMPITALPTSSNTSLNPTPKPPTPPLKSFSAHSPFAVAKDPERGQTPFISSSSSSQNSAIDPPAPNEIPWGPAHPCFPHPNPHVPLSSPLHQSTRIIRIRRDWMLAGDLAPTFSNIYPEILEPWVSEQDFRILVRTVNDGLMQAFKPGGWRAWLDAMMGVATGWLWEDLGFAGVKTGVRQVEGFIEGWNGGKDGKEGEEAVKVVPLRRTGYLSLDIQIPDPQVGVADPTPTTSRPDTGNSRPGPLPRNQ